MSENDLPLNIQIANRYLELGLFDPEVTEMPAEVARAIRSGKSMLLVKRGPEVCSHCGKLKVIAAVCRPTKTPLEELFRP